MAASTVESGKYDDQFLIDIFQTGSGASTNMNVNEVVAHLASDAANLSRRGGEGQSTGSLSAIFNLCPLRNYVMVC